MSSPIVLQWRKMVGSIWETLEVSGVPVSYPSKIRIDFSMAGALPGLESLIDKIKDLISRVRGTITSPGAQPLAQLDAGDALLEVLVSDGETRFQIEARIAQALQPDSQTWVLPLMPKGGAPAILPADLKKQNIAFWTNSIDELALTVLARAGVTSLSRRIFISYRRVDTEPIAAQLFDALTDRNFHVFLDTVSVDPGVNFQASLFEQLADKSMVVLLHSKTFAQSEWTMAELTYVKEHDLSPLIIRFPSVEPNDPLDAYYRAGDVIRLRDSDLTQAGPGTLAQLKDYVLAQILNQIIEVHDIEMINRLALLRQKTLDALAVNIVNHNESTQSASIFAQSDTGGKSYRLFPTSRPPGLPELFEASTLTREQGDRRIVVGRISAFNADRRKHLDWIVLGRNVIYTDVTLVDYLARQIKGGLL